MAVLTKEAEERIINLLLAEGLADSSLVFNVQNNLTPDQSFLAELVHNNVVNREMVARAASVIIGVP